jgi:hypothetical protein
MHSQNVEKLRHWRVPGLVAVALAIPLTVVLAQQIQEVRQDAAKPSTPTRMEARNVPLSGYVYNDANENGLRDVDEKGVADVAVQIAILPNSGKSAKSLQNATQTTVMTDSQGHFLHVFAPAIPQSDSVMTITVSQQSDSKLTTQNPITILNKDLTGLHVVEFGILSQTAPCEEVPLDDVALDENPLPEPCPTTTISGTPVPTAPLACPSIGTASCAPGTVLKVLKSGPGKCARYICQKPETSPEPTKLPKPSK